MKRWNGWGNSGVTYKVYRPAKEFIQNRIGSYNSGVSLKLKEVIANLSKSRLRDFPNSTTDDFQRLIHSYGHSFPDWLKFKMGLPFRAVDAVAFPETEGEIYQIIQRAIKDRVAIIPYGGGTSVVGHLEIVEDRPTLSVDLSRLNRVLSVDEKSAMAEIESGAKGPWIENQLNIKGYTLGHFPQSFELSTLGGWIVTKSSGQFSYRYGSIEDMFLGGNIISPTGMFKIDPFVRAATGLDLREIIIGSEGRIGIISKAFMKISKLPESEVVEAAFLNDDSTGIEVVRFLSNSCIPFSMLRLSLSKETQTMLSLVSHKWWYKFLNGYVNVKGLSKDKCMLLFAVSGNPKQVRLYLNFVRSTIKRFGGINLGSLPGKTWLKDRFKTPYLRNTLWDMGFGVETLETSTLWSNVPILVKKIEDALAGSFAFSHLSHVYPSGSSIYTTFIFGLSKDPQENYHRWKMLKLKASKAIVENGGVISHHHGVGLYHKSYLVVEKKEKGLDVIRKVIREFDPYEVMNPGKLID